MKREKTTLENIAKSLTKIIINKTGEKFTKKGQDIDIIEDEAQDKVPIYKMDASQIRKAFLEARNDYFASYVAPAIRTDDERRAVLEIQSKLNELHRKHLDRVIMLAKNHAGLYEAYENLLKKDGKKESNWWDLYRVARMIFDDPVREQLLKEEIAPEWEKIWVMVNGNPNLSRTLKEVLSAYVRRSDPSELYFDLTSNAERNVLRNYPPNPLSHPHVQRMNAIESIFWSPVAAASIGGIPVGGTAPVIPLPPHLFGIKDNDKIYAPEFNWPRRFAPKTIYHDLLPPPNYRPVDTINRVLAHVAGNFWPYAALRLALGGAESLPTNVRKELRGDPEFIGADRFLPRPPYPDLPIEPSKE